MVHSKLPTKSPSKSSIRGPSIISNQKSLHITQIGSIQKNLRKPPSPDPSSHQFTRPSKIPLQYPSCKHFKNKSTEPPYTHPTYHPSCPHIKTPSNCPTPNPSHTWDVPGLLGIHTGHIVLVIKSGPHLRVQSWMYLCI